jgi:hypothetical protein
MLDLSPAVGYINEPFNPTHQPGICSASFPLWFQYIHPGNEGMFLPPLAATLRFRYQLPAQLHQVKSLEDGKQLLRDGSSFVRSRFLRARPLIKDPIAAFSADWLATTFEMSTVVVIRHPAAFAASLKRLDWWPPFQDLLAQPALLEDLLSEFEPEIRQRAQGYADLVDRAASMWMMMYTVLLRFKAQHPDWLLVRQEDLARDPVREFRGLFGGLGIQYTPRIAERVLWHSSAPTGRETDPPAHEVRRDSGETVRRWRQQLTPDEAKRIRDRVDELSRLFYLDSDW